MSNIRSVKYLVTDSNAFIKGAPLHEWTENVITVRDVIREIKDAKTRQQLQFLPYEIIFREPSNDSIRHITEFSKKTGDYPSLSAADIKVMALAYQLECEEGKSHGGNLRSEPSRTPQLLGKDRGNGDIVAAVTDDINSISLTDNSTDSDCHCDDSNGCQNDNKNHNNDGDGCHGDGGHGDGCHVDDGDLDNDGSDSDDGNGDDDDNGWIHPDNLSVVCESLGGCIEQTIQYGTMVGCITSDYSMQNVLLQIGLNVVSIDGLLVKSLKVYSLQCKACYKICHKIGTVFCPHCGNRALIKVSVNVSSDGIVTYHSLSSKQFSRKGLRYSLPRPRGGRQPNITSLLSPSQKVTFRLPGKKEKVDPLGPDYVAGTSPFLMKDVTSRGAQMMFRGGGKGRAYLQAVGSSWRRNPNQSKKKRK
jgi:RNA-binding protein NOB1